ncbi:pyruvate dehydrogenase (acetyl-transferring) E1 component subunit alpha [Agromyces sp. SYSU T00194]|uniref:pyruvate dehydrogenase (acetyl-transferring) E1 component subunit alpha n=1 Tax=Agromyces chitinivorans TaxID=3158560 RepID=UPI00339269A8
MTLSDGRDTDAHLRPEQTGTAASGFVQLLDPDGARVSAPGYDQWVADLDDAALVALYRDMVVIHRVDAEATALQRQGEIGLWPPLAGQEAAQVGSAHALREDDFVFSSYREHAVAWCRGLRPEDLLKVWRGVAGSGWDPYELGMATPQIIIAAQTLHAVGYAMGIQRDGTDQAAIAYFGDGATSEGDASEALVFAATYKAPVVFFCQNNQWAISEPVGLQSTQHLAQRAAGFGIPWMRVDGNDVLAVMAATRIALERARSGGGPTYIEAVTYRMGPHTTADDPKRYRTEEELEAWRRRDPIARLEALLRARGALDDGGASEIAREADAAAAAVRAACVGMPDPEPLSIFDHVYAEPNSHVERQRDHYARYLAMFDDPGDGGAEAAR